MEKSEITTYSELPGEHNIANYHLSLKISSIWKLHAPIINNACDNHNHRLYFFISHLALCRLNLTKLSGVPAGFIHAVRNLLENK